MRDLGTASQSLGSRGFVSGDAAFSLKYPSEVRTEIGGNLFSYLVTYKNNYRNFE